MSTTRNVIQQHDKFLDSLVGAFGEELQPIVNAAQKKTLKALESKLTFASDGSIEYTPANQLALRSIDRLFKRQMKIAGYDKLTAAFTDQFADHLPKFEDVLHQIMKASAKADFYSDKSGPVTVYKGMPKKNWRTGLDIEEIRSANGPWAGFFTSEREVAEKFARLFGNTEAWPSHVVAAHLKMKNPFVVDAKGAPARDFQFDQLNEADRNTVMRKAIENPKYDGVVIKNTKDEGTIYVPKDPGQIVPLNAKNPTAEALPEIKFTPADVNLFASQALGAKEMLADVVETVGAGAKRQALFSVGGLKFSDLAQELGTRFSKTAAEAKTLADFSLSSFYRTIASQSYTKIETGLAAGAVRYFYAGPSDELEREFCANLTDRGLTYTRDQIDAMDNGTGLPVFTSGGGYRCRHLWILNVAEAEAKGAA